MKKTTLILVMFTIISNYTSGQTAGDYQSVSSGNWNDATNWQVFDGNNWVNTNAYPGQNSGTGTVTITNETQIAITITVPYPIASLYINRDFNQVMSPAKLIFSSGNAISLMVTGSVFIYGSLLVNDQAGLKSHSLFIGGSLEAGSWIYVSDSTCTDVFNCPGYYSPLGGDFQSINGDDKLRVIFNTTASNSSIRGSAGITFQDIEFNGVGISVETQVYIDGTAKFINGIVKSNNVCTGGIAIDASGSSYYPPTICPVLYFNQQATVLGSSSASFVDGRVWKNVTNSFTFPIGNGGVYSPLTVTTPGYVGTLSARYVRSTSDPISRGITDAGLYSVSNCEYWELNAGSAFYYDNNNAIDYPLNVTVEWNNFSRCDALPYVTNVSEVRLARLNFADKTWATHGGSASGSNENGAVTWTGVTNLGAFTLGNINTNCSTPSQLITTNISATAATLNWSSVPGSVSYDVDYLNANTNHWTNAATGIASTSFNLSGLDFLATYYWRVRANCGSSSSAYRLTQFTTLNPCEAPSGLITTNITSTSATLKWNAVPNAVNYTVGYKQSTTTSWIYPSSGVSTLSYTLAGLAPGTFYDWRVSALCQNTSDPYSYIVGNLAQSSFTTSAVSSVCNDTYETNNTSSQAKAINLGTLVKAGISSSTDVDWFKVTTSNNSKLQITLGNLPADYDLYVYNKNLVFVGSSANTATSNEAVIVDPHTKNATFYIEVAGKNGVYNTAQCYDLLAQPVNTGGAITSSPAVTGKADEALNKSLLYPIPASQFLYLNFSSEFEQRTDVEIINTIGQSVKQYSISVTKGYNSIRLSVMNLLPGTYILKMNNGRVHILKKFIIAR